MLQNQRSVSFAYSAPGGFKVADGCTVYRGSIVVMMQDGTIAAAGTKNPPAPPVCVVGISTQDCLGDGKTVEIRRDYLALPFDTDPKISDYGKPVYVVDDEFVSLDKTSKTQDGSAGEQRLQAGILAGIDQNGTAFIKILEGLGA